MALYLDKPAVDTQISQIKKLIGEMEREAQNIDKTVVAMQENWKGNSADKVQNTYREEYRNLITKTVPEALEQLRDYMDKCVKAIADTDNQLSGR